jgi:hypothetical protein
MLESINRISISLIVVSQERVVPLGPNCSTLFYELAHIPDMSYQVYRAQSRLVGHLRAFSERHKVRLHQTYASARRDCRKAKRCVNL